MSKIYPIGDAHRMYSQVHVGLTPKKRNEPVPQVPTIDDRIAALSGDTPQHQGDPSKKKLTPNYTPHGVDSDKDPERTIDYKA